MTRTRIEDLGAGLKRATLENESLRVSILNFGARAERIQLLDQDILLYYADPHAYLTDTYYLGAMIGRVAGRIQDASVQIDQVAHALEANEGTNTLHGGLSGISQQFWT